MTRFIRKLGIFLKLKWDETLGKWKWTWAWLVPTLSVCGFFGAFSLMLYGIVDWENGGRGVLTWVGIILLGSIILSLLVVTLLELAPPTLKGMKRFLIWMRSNWREAEKRLREREIEKQREK